MIVARSGDLLPRKKLTVSPTGKFIFLLPSDTFLTVWLRCPWCCQKSPLFFGRYRQSVCGLFCFDISSQNKQLSKILSIRVFCAQPPSCFATGYAPQSIYRRAFLHLKASVCFIFILRKYATKENCLLYWFFHYKIVKIPVTVYRFLHEVLNLKILCILSSSCVFYLQLYPVESLCKINTIRL